MFNHCTVGVTWWKRFRHQHHRASSKLTSTIDKPNFNYKMRLSQRKTNTVAAIITRRLRNNQQIKTGISAFYILTWKRTWREHDPTRNLFVRCCACWNTSAVLQAALSHVACIFYDSCRQNCSIGRLQI